MEPSSPSLLERPALAKLKRPALQKMAIKEHIKANAKNADIIRLLLQKHPNGVPGGRTLSHVSRRLVGPGRNATHALEGQSKKRRVGPGSRTYTPVASSARPPGNKDVRFVKRQLTNLINDGTAIRDEVEETELVLGRAMSIANEISGDIRELTWIRYKLEFDVLREMKDDRTLWDGTRVMTDLKARNKWEGFLEELRTEELARQNELEHVSSDCASQSDSSSPKSLGSSQTSSQGRKRKFGDLEDST